MNLVNQQKHLLAATKLPGLTITNCPHQGIKRGKSYNLWLQNMQQGATLVSETYISGDIYL